MSPELEKYYTDRFDMMLHTGWKDLMEDVEKMRKAYRDIGPLTDSNELWYAKGRVDILDWLLTLKKTSEDAFEELSGGSDAQDF
jgi:hypothetical protein